MVQIYNSKLHTHTSIYLSENSYLIQIKMTAEFACGQIPFKLKNSNLHYLIKETHLSAYITIKRS